MRFLLKEWVQRANGTEDLTLYHNTKYKYIKDILKYGLKQEASKSELQSDFQSTWAVDHPYNKDNNIFDYGGCTVIFKLPKDCRYEKVNDDQYIIYDDIPAEYIIDIDYMLGMPGAPVKTSTLQSYINEYGVDKVRQVLETHHNKQIPIDELKQLTPQLNWN